MTAAPPPVVPSGTVFRDRSGRQVLLRGVNLGGSSKMPRTGAPGAMAHPLDPATVGDCSFVGRPFDESEADEHLDRLSRWGFNTLRFLTTWEAVEHAAPGIHDEDYLAFYARMVKKAGEHGFVVFVDPHQDVWSRATGGDGAPMWTMTDLGMDITRFSDAEAALLWDWPRGRRVKMGWGHNYARAACATMWTLFFGGDRYAPNTTVGGEPVQQWLQRHFLASMGRVADALADAGCDNVIGIDSLNEPHPGFIGVADLREPAPNAFIPGAPTAWEAIRKGDGQNAAGVSMWRDGAIPVWEAEGVYGRTRDGGFELLAPEHFAVDDADQFHREHLWPLALAHAATARRALPGTVLFFENDLANHVPPEPPGPTSSIPPVGDWCYAGHWYDTRMLFTKTYGGEGFDAERMRTKYREQIGGVARRGWSLGVPSLIGEVGIPFDMNDSAAYTDGDWTSQRLAYRTILDTMDELQLNFTLWNYTADNTNAEGDGGWNGEDLSIWSADQRSGRPDIDPLDDGGRVLDAVIRPYPAAVAGNLVSTSFDPVTRVARVVFDADPDIAAPTEIVAPVWWYPQGPMVIATSGEVTMQLGRVFVRGAEGQVEIQLHP